MTIAKRLTSHFHLTTAGTKLHYLQLESTEGSLLLCIHGLGGSTDTFLPLLPSLPQIYKIILVDLQGFGKSPVIESPNAISITRHVADMGDLVAALQGPPELSQQKDIVIIGHSLGAIVALQFAAKYPSNVSGLALLSPGRSAAHIPAVRRRMLDLAVSVRAKGIAYAADLAARSNFYEDTHERTVDPHLRDKVRKAVLEANPEAYARTCEAVVDIGHTDPSYNLITAPAVFVAGDKDVISPTKQSRDLSALMGGRSWVEVVKSGHQPILEDLAGVQQAIQRLFHCVMNPSDAQC